MKTLVISVDYPLPENKGSRIRTMHFVRFFQERGEVDLMCYRAYGPSGDHRSPFRKEFYLDVVADCGNGSGRIIDSLRSKFVECKPWIVNSFDAATVEYVHKVITAEKYDVILCRYTVNAYPLLGLPAQYRRRVVLDVDDLMTGELYDVVNGNLKGLTKVKAAIDKVIFRKYQQKCLEMGKILFCSEEDRAKMVRPDLAGKMFVAPNIVPRQEIPAGYKRSGYDNKTLLFVGALSYQPNETGIIWFIDNIYRKLPEDLKGTRLLVVGKDPKERLKEICSEDSNIELVENPPDVLPYYERCHALVVPVLVGGGTRIKILEAGNCLRPVISTVKGAYGLSLEDCKHIVHFSDRKSFVEKMRWLADEANYRQVTDSLGRVVQNRYSEKVFVETMEKVISGI